MKVKSCLCQQITPSEDTDRRRPRVSGLSDTGQGHSDCSSSFFSQFPYAALTYVHHNSAAIRDQHGAGVQAPSLTRGSFLPEGADILVLSKNSPKELLLILSRLFVCLSAWNSSGPAGQMFGKI